MLNRLSWGGCGIVSFFVVVVLLCMVLAVFEIKDLRWKKHSGNILVQEILLENGYYVT